MKQILINSEELQTRVAVITDGVLQDFFIERTTRDRLVGSIYKGRIRNLESSLQAAFVDIGCGKNAFLHYEDMIPALRELDDDSEDGEESLASDSVSGADVSAVPAEPAKKGFFARFQQLTESPAAETPSAPAKKAVKKSGGRLTPQEIEAMFSVDQEILVQVIKGPIGTKGARVSTSISLPGRYLVLLPGVSHVGISRRVEERAERERLRQLTKMLKVPQNIGLICRTVGAGCTEEHFQRDLDILLSTWSNISAKAAAKKAPCCVYQEPDLAERTIRDCLTEEIDEIVTDSAETFEMAKGLIEQYNLQHSITLKRYEEPTPIFQRYGLTQQLESIFNRRVSLPSGGYICIDETEALIAIDVNSGKNHTAKDQPEAILATNLEAVAEIARQLRLRNVGGLVVLDLIDMASKKDQQLVIKTLREHVANDHARIKLAPLSPFGLLEMTRQRENESVESTIYDNCPYCKGRGLIKNATSMSADIQRKLNEVFAKRRRNQILRSGQSFRLAAHPRVLERFRNEDAKVLQGIEKEYGIKLALQPDASLHIEEFHIFDAVSNQEL